MVLGLALGTPVGTPRWVLGLALGTQVGTPASIRSTCTTGTVLCGCKFEFRSFTFFIKKTGTAGDAHFALLFPGGAH